MMNYTEDTEVFVITNGASFARFADLGEARQWALAFTSIGKAKEFIAITGLAADRVLPITLREWFEQQEEKDWPDLAIDTDPVKLRDHPLRVEADMNTHNICCITHEHIWGKSYEVAIGKRESGASDAEK